MVSIPVNDEQGSTQEEDSPSSNFKSQDNPGMAAWRPISIQLSCLLLGVLLQSVWPATISVTDSTRWILFSIFLATGVAIIALSFREFAKAKTTLRPDCGAEALIRSGPFRYSRNSLYVAVALLIVGIGFGAETVWILAMVIPLVLIMSVAVIAREERYLEREFGQEYLDYKKSVRRWV